MRGIPNLHMLEKLDHRNGLRERLA